MSKSIMVASTASSVGLGPVLWLVAATASGDRKCEFLAGISLTIYPPETPQVHRQPRPSGQPVCLRRRQALRLRLLGAGRAYRRSVRRRFLGQK